MRVSFSCEHAIELVAIAGKADLLADDDDELAENWHNPTATVGLAVEWASRSGPPAVNPYLGGRPGVTPSAPA